MTWNSRMSRNKAQHPRIVVVSIGAPQVLRIQKRIVFVVGKVQRVVIGDAYEVQVECYMPGLQELNLCTQFFANDVGGKVDVLFSVENVHAKPDAVESKFGMCRTNT
jgi:hypothetical protein